MCAGGWLASAQSQYHGKLERLPVRPHPLLHGMRSIKISPPKRTLGIVMDPIASIKPYKDTTLALMLAAQQRGYALFYFEMHDLWLRDGVAYGRAHRVTVFDDKKRWFEFGDTQVIELGTLNQIMMQNGRAACRDKGVPYV